MENESSKIMPAELATGIAVLMLGRGKGERNGTVMNMCVLLLGN
jgi:hypothetical protein